MHFPHIVGDFMIQFIGVMSDHITTRDLYEIFLGKISFPRVCYSQLILPHVSFLNFKCFPHSFNIQGTFSCFLIVIVIIELFFIKCMYYTS